MVAKLRYLLLCVLVVSVTAVPAWAQVGELSRSAPARQGVNPVVVDSLMAALTSLPDVNIHHVMVMRHGHVIGELHAAPFGAEDRHILYSATKMVVALAVGLAVDDGLLNVNDLVADHLGDMFPKQHSAALDSLTIYHLLTMQAGSIPGDTLMERFSDWLPAWFATEFSHVGDHFKYDSMCTHALAMIVHRLTHRPMSDYVNERLFAPMHITQADWELAPDGEVVGAWGLRLQAESQAKLGQLMLNKGRWHGQQLVSEGWIEQMTHRHTSTEGARPPKLDWKGRLVTWLRRVWHEVRSWVTGVNVDDYYKGYGYQTKSILMPRAEIYFASGYGGQLIYVVPKCDLVVVVNGIAKNYGDETHCLYDYLVCPLVEQGEYESTDSAMGEAKFYTASLPTPQGQPTSDVARALLNRRLVLNKAIGCSGVRYIDLRPLGDDELEVTFTTDSTEMTIVAAYGRWHIRRSNTLPCYSMRAQGRLSGLDRPFVHAAAYAWQSDGTLHLRYNWVDGGDFRDVRIQVEDVHSAWVTLNDNWDPELMATVRATIQRAE